MNFFKRALQYLWDKKGKSLLLIAVLSTIMIFVLAGLTIYSAAKVATDNAKKSVGATVTLTVNRENMFKNTSNSTSSSASSNTSSTSSSKTRPDPGSFTRTPINLSDAEKIAKLAGIKSYVFTASTSANQGDDIGAISSSQTSSSTSDSSTTSDTITGASQSMNGKQNPDGNSKMQQGDFRIQGVSDSNNYESFSSGTAKLIKGEAITSEDRNTNNVLIEKSLAQANDLSVGDTFKIKNANDEDVTVKIKGIYETTDTGDSMGMQFNFMNPANTIISSYTFIATIKDDGEAVSLDSATYTLEDPKQMSSFVKKAEKLIDTDTFSLQTNDQLYQQMLQPLNNVASFAKNIVLLVAVAGIVILTLIVMMSIRERRFEIGVLLSLGESRFKVIGQFFIELVVCMVFALGIASFSGNLVGNALGNQLLAQQTTSQTSTQKDNQPFDMPGQPRGNRGGGMRQQMQNVLNTSDEVKKLKITVQPKQIASLAGIGLGISLLSIMVAAANILRLNPKKILID